MFVTGAANGIGYEIAKAAVDAQYKVGMVDTDLTKLEEVTRHLSGTIALPADVTKPVSVADAFDRFTQEFGAPTTVINNAGIVRFGMLLDQPVEDFVDTISVNLIGTYIVAREAARRMAEGGHIINITSINSITPGPGAGAYPAAKSGVKQLTRQLAIELGPKGIRCNAISPGFIDAGMSAPIYADQKVRQTRSGAVPLGRLGTAADIAAAVMYLDAEAGAYVNGHELVVDGGVVHSLLNQLPRD